ncbi:hypothetical protein HHL17_23965 [Chitinophaga sp. G-6-1-13]|uniref:Terpene synthase n=1 Tax=Chitinophaga fulva TaxID=2728842 RepID=A0A848GNT7_9BACT|nr:terpene synthase family protein [Chitinophaga fulva]NML40275.1 hypothetical protein [Chitinophaga fulva]
MEINKPSISYPFADAINPYAAWLEGETRRWLSGNYPSLPDDIKEKYYHTATGYITARFFPFVSQERLIPLGRSSLWGLAFDDYYEHSRPKEYQSLSKRLSMLICGEDTPNSNENEFFHQMFVIANEFRQFMPDYWMQRFANSMRQYIHGMAEESIFKRELIFPSLDEYVNIRWKSVDVLQMVDGLEVATGEPLPDIIRHHPYMEQIVQLTCRIIAWTNDYFSVDKEEGLDVMNLILVLRHAESLSIEDATQEAIQIHNQDVREYLELCEHLPNFGSYNSTVQKFLIYNNYMIAGHARWYTADTKRYLPGGHPIDDFKNLDHSHSGR